MRKMPWEEGFNPDDENAGDDGAPDPGAVSTGAMARLAELPAESDALSAGNTKTLDRVGDTSFPEADELAPKPPPRAPMSAPAPELPPVTPRPAFLDGAPGLDEAPHVAKPLAASPEEYANETAPLGNSPKLTGDLSLKSQRVLGPKDLDQVGRPPPGPVDAPEDPIASGAKRDRMNQLMRAIELGGKQANAGLGGGPVGALVTEKSDFEGDARKEADTAATKANAKAIDERNFAEKKRENDRADEERKQRIADGHATAMEKRQAMADKASRSDPASPASEKARKNFEMVHPEAAAKLKASGNWEEIPADALPDAEKNYEFGTKEGETQKQHGISNKIGERMAGAKEAMVEVMRGKFGQQQAALDAPVGWEKTDKSRSATAFRDVADADKFTQATASVAAMGNHAEDAKRELAEYQAIPLTSIAEKARAAAKVNQAMNFFSAKSRVAEGLNSSDQANSTAESMIGMQHGSAFNIMTVSDPKRIPALLDAAMESSKNNVAALGKVHNINPAGAGTKRAYVMKDGRLVPAP